MTEPAKPLEPLTLNPYSWIEKKPDGTMVERQHICPDCQRIYTQHKIAFRFVESLAKGRGERAANTFIKDVPEGWVPVLCPPCESKELGRIADRRNYVHPIPDNIPMPPDRVLPRGDR